MKTLLEIGGSVRFIAPDAATAAKVADLLGQMQPVRAEWDTSKAGPTEYVLIHGRTIYSHRVQIQSLEERKLFKDEAAFTEWQRERAATEAAATPPQEGGGE